MPVFLLATWRNACFPVILVSNQTYTSGTWMMWPALRHVFEEDIRQFLEFASSFRPNLEYTWSVSTDKLPFLDICIKPQGNRIATSIQYKVNLTSTLQLQVIHTLLSVSQTA